MDRGPVTKFFILGFTSRYEVHTRLGTSHVLLTVEGILLMNVNIFSVVFFSSLY